MSKTIWIRCKQVIEFSQQHTVSDEEYKILMEEADGGDVQEPMKWSSEKQEPYHIIESYLRYNDILDCEREFTDISIELDKPKKPKRKSTKSK